MKIISQQDLSAFVELTGAKIIRKPDAFSSKLEVEVKVMGEVMLKINCVGILRTIAGDFYARHDYNFVRVPSVEKSYIDGDYNLFGKGCRSVEVSSKVRELIALF